MFERNFNFVILKEKNAKAESHTAKLTEYSSNCRTENTHFRENSYTENQERVKNNIYNCTEKLG